MQCASSCPESVFGSILTWFSEINTRRHTQGLTKIPRFFLQKEWRKPKKNPVTVARRIWRPLPWILKNAGVRVQFSSVKSKPSQENSGCPFGIGPWTLAWSQTREISGVGVRKKKQRNTFSSFFFADSPDFLLLFMVPGFCLQQISCNSTFPAFFGESLDLFIGLDQKADLAQN